MEAYGRDVLKTTCVVCVWEGVATARNELTRVARVCISMVMKSRSFMMTRSDDRGGVVGPSIAPRAWLYTIQTAVLQHLLHSAPEENYFI